MLRDVVIRLLAWYDHLLLPLLLAGDYSDPTLPPHSILLPHFIPFKYWPVSFFFY